MRRKQWMQETEKAVRVNVKLTYTTCVIIGSSDGGDVVKTWIPKKLIDSNGAIAQWFIDKLCTDIHFSNLQIETQKFLNHRDEIVGEFQYAEYQKRRQEKLEAGRQRYEKLVDFQKQHNVKGIRSMMKTSTILAKLKEAGIEYPG